MPGFLYPAFLLGAAAVAVPILLHLLRNQQAPELRFSAVRLLRGVRVEQAQRRRIRDWLLLAFRISALLLLTLAFARPYFAGQRAAGGQDTIVLLDRSASMAVPAVWTKATEAVRRTIDAASPRDAVGLIAFDDKPELIAQPTLDRGALKGAVERVSPGIGSTRYAAALARAVSLLEERNAGRGRIVLVSDLQGTSGDARATLPESVTLDVVDASAEFENVALVGTRRADEGIVATIRNDGAGPRTTRLRLEGAGNAAAEARIEVPPGQTVETLIRTALRDGEIRVALTASDGNALVPDDARFLAVDTAPSTRVLVIASPEEAFYVDAALRAGDGRPAFDVTTVAPSGAAAAVAGKATPDVIFVLGPRGLDRGAREALLRFARRGGGIFVASSDPGFGGLLGGLEISEPRGDDALLTLAAFDTRHPLFRSGASIGEGLAAARFTRAWRVRAQGWRMIARFDDGAGALYERDEERGRVVFFASDLNRGWNDLPVQTAFVPFVQETARYLAPAAERREYTPATLPSGMTASLGFVELPSGRRAAVNFDPRESDPARLDAPAFQAAILRRPDREVDEATARRQAQAVEGGQSLWRYGLMLMFATLVAEGVIASRVRRA
jgi:hypothetical protein